MPINELASSFLTRSRCRVEDELALLICENRTVFRPYSAGIYHAHAFAYPLINTVNCIYSSLRIAYGLFLTVPAILCSRREALPQLFKGMAFELGALLLSVINAVYSSVLLLTRSLFTCFSFGYYSPNNKESEYTRHKSPDGRLSKLIYDGQYSSDDRSCYNLSNDLRQLNDYELRGGLVVSPETADEALLLATYNTGYKQF